MILLTDGYLANGAEPWKLPDVDALPDISVPFATEPNHGDEFWPYLRDPETLARPWAIPGTPGLMHRIGGIEKEDGTGNVSYDPENHEHDGRASAPTKIAGIANDIPPVEVDDRRRRRLARARLGEHVGRDRARRCAASARAVSTIAHAHLRAPEPVPAEPRRGAAPLPEGARARDEPRPAVASWCGPSSSSTRRAHARCRACRSARPRSRAKILEMIDAMSDDDGDGNGTPVKLGAQGLPVATRRSAGARAAATTSILTAIQLLLPELGVQAREPRVRVGHRLRGALPVLHEHVRHARHPRPRARGRDRRRAGPSRPRRVGDRRRRRHAVDRRQPPDPRAAPQREPQDPDVQQPDLRAHQGPVLADERGRQDHEVDAVRLARPPVQPDLGRARRRGDASSPAPTTWTAST